MLVNCKKSCNQCTTGYRFIEPKKSLFILMFWIHYIQSLSSRRFHNNTKTRLVNDVTFIKHMQKYELQFIFQARDICSNLPQITPNYPAYNYGTIFGIFKASGLNEQKFLTCMKHTMICPWYFYFKTLIRTVKAVLS